MTIGLIDYGAGNLTSVLKGLSAVGACARVVRKPDDIDDVVPLVIPGVGHFDVTKTLNDVWRSRIGACIDRGVPVFGICLGMHWLFEGSEEAPDVAGLGLFSGRCQRLTGPVKVPHVGWNTLSRTPAGSRMLAGVADGAWAYFTHAFAAPAASDAVAITTHGAAFTSCVERGSVWGMQCHPEKSGATGERVLANFVALAKGGT